VTKSFKKESKSLNSTSQNSKEEEVSSSEKETSFSEMAKISKALNNKKGEPHHLDETMPNKRE